MASFGGPFNFDGMHCPFLYSTNGEVFWSHDVRHPMNRSRRIAGFHTPAALRAAWTRLRRGDRKALCLAQQPQLPAARVRPQRHHEDVSARHVLPREPTDQHPAHEHLTTVAVVHHAGVVREPPNAGRAGRSRVASPVHRSWLHRPSQTGLRDEIHAAFTEKRHLTIRWKSGPPSDRAHSAWRTVVREVMTLADAIECRVKVAAGRADMLPQANLSKAFLLASLARRSSLCRVAAGRLAHASPAQL